MFRRVPVFAALTAVLAVLVAGCSSDYSYVKSSADKTYFKVPNEWTLFDQRELLDDQAQDLSDEERSAAMEQTWQVAFDASPKPNLRHLQAQLASFPAGLALVQKLSGEDADGLSTASMRNLFFDVDTALDDGSGEVVSYEELQRDGGFRGIHMVVRLTTESGKVFTADQTTLVDQGTSRIYALLVRCARECFEKHKDQIDEVVESWTVKAP